VNTFSETFFTASETALPGPPFRDICLESGAHYKHPFSLRKLFLKVFESFLRADYYNAKTGEF
ncbi:hypothetical protein, partial [Kangiella sp.]|uniref:hypothetical protein n=1 Tax=Kangiella sp. TaxID=1920245 RepID=UPI0025C3BBD7